MNILVTGPKHTRSETAWPAALANVFTGTWRRLCVMADVSVDWNRSHLLGVAKNSIDSNSQVFD